MSSAPSPHSSPTPLDQLPLRVEGKLARTLGMKIGVVEVSARAGDGLPALRGTLPKPVAEDVSLVLRVHSSAGIPLASAPVDLRAGDQSFEATRVVMLAMEGYAHLAPAERQAVEHRVWSRRAFATGSMV